MVFSGRPSKACQPCRNRRLKCDLRKDTCSQCMRAHLICGGYRDVSQLQFRDESQSIIKKVFPKKSKDFQAAATICRPVLLSLEQTAQDAFFARYVVGHFKTYDYLQIFCTSPSVDEHLSSSLEAVSLAYLWHQQSSPIILKEARKRYVYALNLTNAALRSPNTANKDSTLLTTILLDLFEKFTSTRPKPQGAWTSHVNGALALVRMRGKAQFSTAVGLRMVVRLTTSFVISFVACETAVPQQLVEIRKYTAEFLDASDPKWRLTDLMVDYASFAEDVRAGNLSDTRIVFLAMELDAKLLELVTTMPPSWRYKTVCLTSASSGVFGNNFCLYPSQSVTQAWNVIRFIRILLNNKICNHFLRILDFAANTDLVKLSMAVTTATHNLETLAADICASGPQYLGSVEISPADCTAQEKPTSDSSQASLQCYALIFPFYIAARYAPGSSVRNWVIEQLHYMNKRFRIKNAHLVAELLERGDDINHWLVYVMLGSYAFAA